MALCWTNCGRWAARAATPKDDRARVTRSVRSIRRGPLPNIPTLRLTTSRGLVAMAQMSAIELTPGAPTRSLRPAPIDWCSTLILARVTPGSSSADPTDQKPLPARAFLRGRPPRSGAGRRRLGDIAKLGLRLSEAKPIPARLQQVVFLPIHPTSAYWRMTR
jgi:hypothetical protein